jgi:hypothetical protein
MVVEIAVETKTARRKRLKAERRGVRQSNGAAELQSLKARFLQRCCSEYWFYQRAANTVTPIGTLCRCEACAEARRFAWPRPHVGSVGISFDCFVEGADIEPGDDRLSRGSITTKREALRGRLTIKRHRPSQTRILKKPCANCEGGLCEHGERYCLKCRAIILRELRAAHPE